MDSKIKSLSPNITSSKQATNTRQQKAELLKATAPATDDSVIANTRPKINSVTSAEALTKSIATSPGLEDAHGQLDEERIKSLLADD